MRKEDGFKPVKYEDLDELADQIGKNTVVFEAGRSLGLAEGRRLERRETRRMVRVAIAERNHEHCDVCWYLGEIILERLAARSKRGRTEAGEKWASQVAELHAHDVEIVIRALLWKSVQRPQA